MLCSVKFKKTFLNFRVCVCISLCVCVSWVIVCFPHSCQSHIPLFCCLSLSSCLSSGFSSLSLLSVLDTVPDSQTPPPSFPLFLSRCVSVTLSRSLSCTFIIAVACQCARSFSALLLYHKKNTNTHGSCVGFVRQGWPRSLSSLELV